MMWVLWFFGMFIEDSLYVQSNLIGKVDGIKHTGWMDSYWTTEFLSGIGSCHLFYPPNNFLAIDFTYFFVHPNDVKSFDSSVRAIVALNLHNYGSGRNPWGHLKPDYLEKVWNIFPSSGFDVCYQHFLVLYNICIYNLYYIISWSSDSLILMVTTSFMFVACREALLRRMLMMVF